MILEQFEIENWSCIRRVAVTALPAAGVVVLHGPNGTGKSSIVAALRATLFDFQPTSTKAELKRFFPNWTDDAPRVTVGLKADGKSYRVTKQFKKSGECRLEERRGDLWVVITRSPAEVHDQTLALVGNKGSDKGLPQLLWLRQTEYRLPDKKDFDPDIQAQLRNILGVMQTPLDDGFIDKVKERWRSWFSARNQPGEKAKLTKSCELQKDLDRLVQAKAALSKLDADYGAIEKALMRADYLESDARRLRSELEQQEAILKSLRVEGELSQARRSAFEFAQHRATSAEEAVKRAKERQKEQTDEVERCTKADDAEALAKTKADQAVQMLVNAEQERDDIKQQAEQFREKVRHERKNLDVVEAHQRIAQKRSTLVSLSEKLHRAEELHLKLKNLRQRDLDEPAPPQNRLAELETNRTNAARYHAELHAAAMSLAVTTEPGAMATLMIDGIPAATTEGVVRWSVHLQAELSIPGWGRVEVARGTDARGLDSIERDLENLDRNFRDGVTPYGLTGRESNAIERLRSRAADQGIRNAERRQITDEIKRLGADDLDALRSEFHLLDTAVNTDAAELADSPPISNPDESAKKLRERLKVLDAEVERLKAVERDAVSNIEQKPTGYREQASNALTRHAEAKATVRAVRDALNRLASSEELAAGVNKAEEALTDAQTTLSQSRLSDEENTLPERLVNANTGYEGIKDRLAEVLEELHKLQGSLSKSAGLHQDRAEAAAVVDGLTRKTEREMRESRAYDRLYELFEECRQKQFSTVVGPVTDRVLRWMRLAGITDYGSIECGDNFLPHTLGGKAGRQSISLEHESTGTQEQIALMVRLALGSVVSPPAETAVAVLDDPLTHSDPLRLDRMRAVLKAAASGDPSIVPSLGPLQILVFTCRPEWFRVDSTPMIDLGNATILDRAF